MRGLYVCVVLDRYGNCVTIQHNTLRRPAIVSPAYTSGILDLGTGTPEHTFAVAIQEDE